MTQPSLTQTDNTLLAQPLKRARRYRKALVGAALLATAASTFAEDQTLECTLYIAKSVDHASGLAVESSGAYLNALRRAGYCVFPDGSIADKQFVMGTSVRDDGAIGDGVGVSTYTFANGDSLTLSFEFGWNANGLNGEYSVLHGTGQYKGATGTGSITGAESPWKTTSVVDIRIDVKTAGS